MLCNILNYFDAYYIYLYFKFYDKMLALMTLSIVLDSDPNPCHSKTKRNHFGDYEDLEIYGWNVLQQD